MIIVATVVFLELEPPSDFMNVMEGTINRLRAKCMYIQLSTDMYDQCYRQHKEKKQLLILVERCGFGRDGYAIKEQKKLRGSDATPQKPP
eukprot:5683264-Amphidinium_carterae.1